MEVSLVAEFHLMPFSYFSANFPELRAAFSDEFYAKLSSDPVNRVLITYIPAWHRATVEVYTGIDGYIHAQNMLCDEMGMPVVCDYVLTDDMPSVLAFVSKYSAIFSSRSDIQILGNNMASVEFMV